MGRHVAPMQSQQQIRASLVLTLVPIDVRCEILAQLANTLREEAPLMSARVIDATFSTAKGDAGRLTSASTESLGIDRIRRALD